MAFRGSLGPLLAFSVGLTSTLFGQSSLEQARSYQKAGQTAELRAAAEQAVSQSQGDAASLATAAQLLDLAGAPGRADAYRRVVEAAPSGPEARAARRRLVLLLLQAGEYEQARRELEAYRGAGGADLAAWPEAAPARPSRLSVGYIEIPGPLLSFQRMAALRPETVPEELLPALARNVVTFGYEFSHRFLKVMPSEYLKLLRAYLTQARELQALAGSEGVLRVKSCSEAAPLLKLLGYRLGAGGCAGEKTSLDVDDPSRAFLTTNSGFPLVQLEEMLQGKQPLEHDVRPVRMPVLLGPNAWGKPGVQWIEAFLDDRMGARLYLAMSHLDTRTVEILQQSPGLEKLRPYAPVLDFFGGMLRVENGRVVVPGGPAAYEGWRQIVGASPESPAAFMTNVIEKDDGWLAAFFDALSRADRPQQAYLTEGARLMRLYRALRSKSTAPGPARPIFRGNAQLMLLVARLRMQSDGRPYLPGGIKTWKSVFNLRPAKSSAAKKGRETLRLETPDEVMEALFARVRDPDENGPLNIFLAVNEIDRLRARPLEPNTILLLTTQYPRFSHHYSLFAEWPQLGSSTIDQFIDVVESLTRVRDPMVRADGLGSLQASIALWEILGRQREIPEGQLESTFTRIITPFSDAENAEQVFEAARKAVQTLLAFRPAASGSLHERMIAMLAAPPGVPDAGRAARDEVAGRLRLAFDAQRLITLDTLFSLAEQLERAAASRTRPGTDFVRLASRLLELNLPNPFPSTAEKNAAFFGYWTERHIDNEREADIVRAAQRENLEKLAKVRGLLAPHLRDTLVGLVYGYYAPPGSMVLHNNPLFVRSHDFLGTSGHGTGNEIWGPGRVSGLGWPWSGGGRFVGSLSGIAYALADAEKDFLVPQQTQSLIWGELAPQMLVSSVVPRWWNVSQRTQHWLALNLRLGADLLAEAAVSPDARRVVLEALGRTEPHRLERVEAELTRGRAAQVLRLVTPTERYRLARQLLAADANSPGAQLARRVGPAAAAIEEMAREYPEEASPAAAAAAFGVPHPKVARSYRTEVLHLPLFPALLGYSSRLLAESWESSNFYWAQLFDELGLHPAEMNRLVPQLTRRMLERIFANHLEDWPAVLNSMLATGEDFRRQMLAEGAVPSSVNPGQ